jgi:hypothetical protein
VKPKPVLAVMQPIGLCLSQGACSAENKVAGIKRGTGEHRVVEVGMVRKFGCVKQGYLDGGKNRPGVRASILAWNRRNGRGVKGGREVDA